MEVNAPHHAAVEAEKWRNAVITALQRGEPLPRAEAEELADRLGFWARNVGWDEGYETGPNNA